MEPKDAVAPATRAPRDQRFNMRMSANHRQVIASAAAAVDKSETDFVLDATIQEAERVLADRRWFVVEPGTWEAFDRLLDEPIPYEDDLRDLLRHRTVFEQP
jgi:uncharacterized protein (DUF1778 family)